MRAREIIFELFDDRRSNIKWNGNECEFTVGDVQYVCAFDTTVIKGLDDYTFCFYSGKPAGGKIHFHNTGDAGTLAVKVFSNVVHVLEVFLNTVKPNTVYFTGNKEKGGFYKRLAQVLEKRLAPGYEMEIVDDTRVTKFLIHKTKQLDEVEIGGYIDDDDFADGLHKMDLSGKQLDLFYHKPTGEPDLPSGYKILGRMGEFYVAQAPREGGYQNYVFVHDGKAAAEIVLHPWDIKYLNYPSENRFRPNLNGKGLRVSTVLVLPEFRGSGLALKIYQWVLNNVCDYLIADSTQTTGGVKLWKRMLNMKSTFAVEVWDGEKYLSRQRWAGKDFNQIYNKSHLIPWVTLQSKLNYVLDGNDDA